MRRSRLRARSAALLAVLVVGLASAVVFTPLRVQAQSAAGAVIDNGTVQLGVNALGDLNYSCSQHEDGGCPPSSNGVDESTDVVGRRYEPLNLDGTAPGCLCEGWGVADAGSGLSGSV